MQCTIQNNNFHPCTLYPKYDIHDIPDFNKLYVCGTGLCNQIFCLINAIIKCLNQRKKFLVVDSFNCCLYDGNICEISKILDIEQTYKELGIQIVDRNNINLEIINVKYGLYEKCIDVTTIINDNFINGKINIAEGTCTNILFGTDPLFGINKKIYMTYKINNIKYQEEIDETKFSLNFDVDYITKDLFKHITFYMSWYNSHNEDLFVSIFKKLVFRKEIINIVNQIGEDLNLNINNVLMAHIRIEDDFVKFACGGNDADKELFKQSLYKKYNNILNKYVAINDDKKIYLLTYAIDDALKNIDEKYVNRIIYTSIEKKRELLIKHIHLSGRELIALLDLLIAIKFGNEFIGNFNFDINSGSTFSYLIYACLNGRKIMINDNENANVYE